MLRKPRVEYAGAGLPHSDPGKPLQKIFRGDTDCEMFLETPGAAQKKDRNRRRLVRSSPHSVT